VTDEAGAICLTGRVPVLFVGGSDPGPLLDRAARGRPPERPVRHDLKLGLRQGEVRFFARDIALRQAVDVLAGRASERILAITGPPGVGKSLLIDRALEELGNEASHVLYVRLEQLASPLKRTLDGFNTGARDWRSPMDDFNPDAPVARLCELVVELLSRGDKRRRGNNSGRGSSEWWARLIEELAQCRFTLVIDIVELIDQLEQVYLSKLMQTWLAQQLQDQNDADDGSGFDKYLEELIDFIRDQTPQTTGAQQNRFVAALGSLDDFLGGLGRLTKLAERQIVLTVEQLLDRCPKLASDAEARVPQQPVGTADAKERTQLIADLKRIESSRVNLADALVPSCVS
jgi:AAA domain